MTQHALPQTVAGFERLLRANRLLMLASEEVARARDIPGLMADLCDFALREAYPMAWVGRLGAPDAPLEVIASAGDRTGYAQRVRATAEEGVTGHGPIGTAIRTGRTVVNHDFAANPAMAPWRALASEAGFASSIGIPLWVEGRIWGVFSVYAAEPDGFDAWETELLEALGRTVAAGVARLTTRDRIIGVMEDVVIALTKAMEARDPYTVGHQARVSRLCVRIGEVLGLEAGALQGLRIAGLLHDIGKIAVPLEVLNKATPLTAAELGLVRRHVAAGHAIVGHIDFPGPVAEAILQHHERLDGSGYPEGLSGDEIGLWARILAVADIVDAMAHARSYRPAMGMTAALAALETGSGRTLDAAVAAAARQIILTDEGLDPRDR